MLLEKEKIRRARMIWLFALILGILIPTVITVIVSIFDFDYMVIFWIWWAFSFINIFLLAIYVNSWLLSCKEYEYEGNHIVVFAGFYRHYISVNGIKVDEHDTIVSFAPIYLSATLEDGADLDAVITTSNRISLKINNRLYTNK